MIPKVLVGVPTSDFHRYCIDQFIKEVKNFSYKNYKLIFTDNSKTDSFYKELKNKNIEVIKTSYLTRARSRVTRDHNLFRKIMLKENYDFLFILDQDVIPPRDAIERLISHNKDIVYGLYFGHHILNDKSNKVMPFAWRFKTKKGHWGKVRYLNPDEYSNKNLIDVAFCGGGCIMIRRNVMEKIKFRYSKNIEAWDDRWLGFDSHKNNFHVYLDPTIKCQHLYLNRPFFWQDLKEKNEV